MSAKVPVTLSPSHCRPESVRWAKGLQLLEDGGEELQILRSAQNDAHPLVTVGALRCHEDSSRPRFFFWLLTRVS